VKALCQDIRSHDFTGFVVHDSLSGDVLGTFRADDIVQQRNFMVALGGCGPGLFTQSTESQQEEQNSLELSQVDGIVQDDAKLESRHLLYDSRLNDCYNIELPSYKSCMKQLPNEFYFSQDSGDGGVTEFCGDDGVTEFSRSEITVYDPTAPIVEQNLLPMHHRKVTDTFLPPHGPPAHSLVSIGYGEEVGLEPHQQAIWDSLHACYFFLDHSAKSTFAQDPRPENTLGETTALKKKGFTYDGATMDTDLPVVRGNCISAAVTAAESAAKKPHGFVLRAHGGAGTAGFHGESGQGGGRGYNGIVGINGDGTDGTDGLAGRSGAPGCGGGNGSDGRDMIIRVSGDSSALNLLVNGQCCIPARLGGDRHREVVLVDCQGGDGGQGGNGGDGGAGGWGGDGGKGGKKGDGGHGGDGGRGGAGGRGGDGGKAGSGGCCVIRTSDPRLLMLVEVNCLAGEPGRGGVGGRSGEGGRRGYGAEGGTWVERDISSTAVAGAVVEVQGMKGKPGATGINGVDGDAGLDGEQSMCGGLLWVVESPSYEVLHQAETRYKATVMSLQLSPARHGSLYEPNQAISVSEVVVRNDGGLSLPKGAKLFFPSTKTISFASTVYELPEIPPNTSITVPLKFKGRIFNQPTPNHPGSFSGEASFSPKIELLGRPFDNNLTQTLEVAYPVRLGFALSRKDVSKGEISVLEVGIENTSTTAFGSSTDCKGSVCVCLHLDSHLIPLGIQKTSLEEGGGKAFPFQVTHDPSTRDSIWVKIKHLQPRAHLTIPIAFLMDPSTQFCDTYVWQASLHYKGKFIEYLAQEVQVTPAYTPPSTPKSLGDVLMVTSAMISRPELALWQKIFDILHVNVDYFDTSIHTPPHSPAHQEDGRPATDASSPMPSDAILNSFSMYRGKTIIHPHCKVEQLSPECIASHFDSPNSGMLIFQPASTPPSLEDHFYDHSAHIKLLRHLCSSQDQINLPDDALSGYHVLSPGTLVSPEIAVRRSEKNVMKRLEREHPCHALAQLSGRYSIKQKSLLKYTYGKMEVRRCPLIRSCNFQCIDGAGGSMVAMGSDDPLLTARSREIPLASKFGQVFLAVLVSIPLQCKLNLFKSKSTCGEDVKFYLPNGRYLSAGQLSAVAVASTVADEVMDCTGNVSRMEEVADDLQTNSSFYAKNGMAAVLNQMLALILLEVADRAKKLDCPAVVSTVRQIQMLCSDLSTLYTAHHVGNQEPSFTEIVTKFTVMKHQKLSARTPSCPGSAASTPSTPRKRFGSTLDCASSTTANIEHLPLLCVLQDSSHVLRTHQLTVRDGCYSVAALRHMHNNS
jgi:hypothetical protein